MKTPLAQAFKLPNIGGFRYSRGVNDVTPPTTPTLLTPIGAGTATLAVSWINGTDAQSGIASTYVEWSLSGLGVWTRQVVPYPITSTIISGLSSQTPYDIRIANADLANPQNVSTYCPIQTVTTLSSSADLAPGTVSIAVSQVSAAAGQPFGVAIARTGGGASSPIIQVDWAFSGFASGSPSPANGTLQWASGENDSQIVQVIAGSPATTQNGTLNIVAVRSLSGNIAPSVGNSVASVSIVVAGTNTKRWPVGHFGLTGNITFPDDRKLSSQIIEQNTVISSGPNVQGWKGFYTTGCFGAGPFTFTQIFRDLNKLRSAGKQMGISVAPQIFGQGADYTDLLPAAIYNSSTYGPSPVAGKHGWWSANGSTETCLAFWRPAVMDWVISLYQALATTVNPTTGLTIDQDPFVIQLAFGETSMGIDPGDATWSPANMVTQYERLILACDAAFPRIIFMCNNNFAGSQANSQALTNYCLAHHAAQGGPDTVPIGFPNGGLSWGCKAAIGVGQSDPVFNGPDLRGQIAMMSDTQGPELHLAKYGPPFPVSIFDFVDQTLEQACMFWTMLNIGATDPEIPAYPARGTNTGTNRGNWNSVLKVINGNPLTHVAVVSSLSGVTFDPGWSGSGIFQSGQIVTINFPAGGIGARADERPIFYRSLDADFSADSTYSRDTSARTAQVGCAIQSTIAPPGHAGSAKQTWPIASAPATLFTEEPHWSFSTGVTFAAVRRYYDWDITLDASNDKMFRVWPGSFVLPDAYFSSSAQNSGGFTHGAVELGGGISQSCVMNFSPNLWMHDEFEFKTSTINVSDGILTFCRNGAKAYADSIKFMTQNTAQPGTQSWGFLNQMSNAPPPATGRGLYFSSLYVTDTLLRVFTSSESTYSSVISNGSNDPGIDREFQLPTGTGGSNTSLQIKLQNVKSGDYLWVVCSDRTPRRVLRFS